MSIILYKYLTLKCGRSQEIRTAPNYLNIFVRRHKFMRSQEFSFGGLQNAFVPSDKNTLIETELHLGAAICIAPIRRHGNLSQPCATVVKFFHCIHELLLSVLTTLTNVSNAS